MCKDREKQLLEASFGGRGENVLQISVLRMGGAWNERIRDEVLEASSLKGEGD